MNQDVYSGHATRRAAWQFLSGKALSALLTFISLLWLVRMLPVAEYGAYVVFIAGTELGFAMAALGMYWLAARYIPDYRLRAAGPALGRLCRLLVLWQTLALMALAAIISILMDVYLSWAGLSDHKVAAWLALALLCTEGLGRFVREGVMAPLMLQEQARVSLILRQSSFLIAIAALSFAEHVDLYWVLAAEVGASLGGCLVASLSLARHLRSLRCQIGEAGWKEPKISEQWRIALRMHAARIISLAYSPQMFLNLVQRILGVEAAALFGFLRTLFEQAGRYLPATLLFTVLRPKLVADHLTGGMAALARQVNLAGKLSLFVLLPLIVLVALAGDTLVAMLSGQRFEASGHYLLGLLLVLLPISQRQLIETVAVSVGRPGLCTLGSVLGLLTLPLMIFLLGQGYELWAPVITILIGEVVFNATVLAGLALEGYRVDWQGATKLVASAFLAWLAAIGAVMVDSNDAISFALACMLAAVVFLAASWWLQVFTHEERQRLSSMLGVRMLAR